jgi:hypothetical protein
MVRIAPSAMELVLLGRLFGECDNLFFGLSLVLRKCHPFANDLSARVVVFHVCVSLADLNLGGPRARPRSTPSIRHIVVEPRDLRFLHDLRNRSGGGFGHQKELSDRAGVGFRRRQ